MKRLILTCAVAQTLAFGTAEAFVYGNKTGALSYSFFNLTGSGCTLTYYLDGPNPLAPAGSPAQAMGWTGKPLDSSLPNDGWGFFNNMDKPNANYQNRIIFYNSPDSIASPVTVTSTTGDGVTGNFSQGQILSFGAATNAIEYSNYMSNASNPEAIGDSWGVNCGSGQSVLMANLASASAGLSSGDSNLAIPLSVSNGFLNPQAPGDFGPFSETSTLQMSTLPLSNLNGMGFVTSLSGVMNFFPGPPFIGESSNALPGGLWAAVGNPNSLAIYSLVPAMFPVNYSAYVTPTQFSSSSISNSFAQTAIFGGHFTVALGDPFIVSSFAAKVLWYLATNPSYLLNDNSFTNYGKGNLLQALNSSHFPIFPASSNAQGYVNWLFNAPSLSAYVAGNLNTAASKPVTHESVWGKMFAGLFQVTMKALDAAALVESGGASAAAEIGIDASVDSATGALTPLGTNAINNAFTSQANMAAPTTQQAPLVVNSSYSSSNLLGMLLVNYAVQAEINANLGFSGGANPLWANANIYAQGECVAASLSVSSNLFSESVECNDQNGQAVLQSSLNPPPYNNVLSQNSTVQAASNQLNIWDAVLTGSNISANGNGMLVLANPSTSGFQPPTQIYNSGIATITTTFNYGTGTYTLTAYAAPTPLSSFGSTPPAGVTINPGSAGFDSNGCSPYQYRPGDSSYSGNGVLTVTSVQGGCPGAWNGSVQPVPGGPITLSLTTCASGSAVDLVPVATQAGGLISASLQCANPFLPTINPYFNTTQSLSYNGHPGPCNGFMEVQAMDASFNTSTGVLTASQYEIGCGNPWTPFANSPIAFPRGPISLDMSTCAPGSAVNLEANIVYSLVGADGFIPTKYTWVSDASLSCAEPAPTTTLAAASQPALNYNQCVSDPNATGGVVALLIGSQPALACACIPSYLSGIGNSNGLVYGYYATGATGTTGSACPAGGSSSNSASGS